MAQGRIAKGRVHTYGLEARARGRKKWRHFNELAWRLSSSPWLRLRYRGLSQM